MKLQGSLISSLSPQRSRGEKVGEVYLFPSLRFLKLYQVISTRNPFFMLYSLFFLFADFFCWS